MQQIFGTDIVNGLAVIVFLATFLVVWSTRMHTMVNYYAIQSLALGLVAAAIAYFTNSPQIYIVALLTIAIKALVIPRMLTYIMETIHVEREVELLISVPASLLASGGLAILAYFITEPIILPGAAISRTSGPTRPIATSARPTASGRRLPKRITIFAEIPSENAAIIRFAGRNARPTCIGL